MKKLLFSLTLLLISFLSYSQSTIYVSGYYRSNGTYVQGHYRTSPNSTRNDNYSTIGNVNPYTGVAGTKPGDGYYSSYSSSYTAPTYSSYTYSTPTYTSYNSSVYSNNTYYYIPSYSTSTYHTSSTYYTSSSVSSYSTYNYLRY